MLLVSGHIWFPPINQTCWVQFWPLFLFLLFSLISPGKVMVYLLHTSQTCGYKQPLGFAQSTTFYPHILCPLSSSQALLKMDCQGLVARLVLDFVLLTTAVEVASRWRELAEKLARVSRQQMEAYEAPHRDKNGLLDNEVSRQTD